MEENTTITLIGTKLAKIGEEFIFKGAAKDCEICKLNKTCLGLNIGSRYRIINLRNGGKLECTVHDCGVCAVEVVEAPVIMTIESRKAVGGSKLLYEPACSILNCVNYSFCNPPALKKGDKFTIINVIGELSEPCERGYSLKVAEVAR